MKKVIFSGVFLLSALLVFAQGTVIPKKSIVAVLPFEASGSGVTAADVSALADQLIGELRSWDTMDIVNDAQSAEYLVRGKLERANNQVVLTATTFDAKTNRALNSAREQAATPAALSSRIFSFAAQVTENIPFPNYLLGKWRAVINMYDGPLTCLLEFRSDRTVLVEQFDTWEHRGDYSLRYQGFGTGTYSYWGYARRTIQGKPADGFVTVNFKLDDALPKYAAISYTRVNFGFNEDKSVFELAENGFGCGDNYSGPSIYPSQTVAYVSFTKIQ